MTTPRRITLSREKGWNLQAVSMALNGRPAVKVDRSTKWGNPYTTAKAGCLKENDFWLHHAARQDDGGGGGRAHRGEA